MLHHIMGRSWLYDRDVYHYDRENTFHFMRKAKEVALYPKIIEENE